MHLKSEKSRVSFSFASQTQTLQTRSGHFPQNLYKYRRQSCSEPYACCSFFSFWIRIRCVFVAWREENKNEQKNKLLLQCWGVSHALHFVGSGKTNDHFCQCFCSSCSSCYHKVFVQRTCWKADWLMVVMIRHPTTVHQISAQSDLGFLINFIYSFFNLFNFNWTALPMDDHVNILRILSWTMFRFHANTYKYSWIPAFFFLFF